MAEITLTDVWKIYNEGKAEGEVQAVKNLNMRCDDGEFVALLGPSGCGKTSTLRMIAGLEEITQGEIRIGEQIVNSVHPSRRDIAMVFETYALYEHLTVRDNIAFPLKVRELPKKEIERRVSRAVEILDMADLLDRMPVQLSDGQKQRVSIGRAIVREPAAFLMDEPISHLDARLRARMRREIKHLHKELGITTVYVTHDQLEATAMADRIAVMNLGELQQLDTPIDLFENPANLFVADFVGEPPMNFLEAEVIRESGRLILKGEGFSVPISESTYGEALEGLDKSKLILGIRPMHIGVCGEETEGAIAAEIYVQEFLDEYSVTTTFVGEQRVLVETEPNLSLAMDETIWLEPAMEKLHLFDPDTGENLLG